MTFICHLDFEICHFLNVTPVVPKSIQNLIQQLKKLPGIGPKSAERLAFHIVQKTDEEVKELGTSIVDSKKGIHLCPECFHFSNNGNCLICSDQNRDQHIICVVETIADLLAVERLGEYRGVYHVLHGRIDPLRHIGPEHIKLQALRKRIEKGKIAELIIATNPDIEGETTAMHIARMFKSTKLKLTRIARGIPSGGNLEFADDMTLRNAIQGRTRY